jgi:hypothetical protein
MPSPAWTAIFLFVLPHVAGMTGTHHHARYWLRWVSQTFCLGWLQTSSFLISNSQVARI